MVKEHLLSGHTTANIANYLGVKKYRFGLAEEEDQIGVVTGLAWTSVGGDILILKLSYSKGKD